MAYVNTTLFAVLSDPGNTALAEAIASTFPQDHMTIRPGQWLITTTGTAKELSDRLSVTPEGTSGSAVIVSTTGYYGRASSQIWEWIAAKIGKTANG